MLKVLFPICLLLQIQLPNFQLSLCNFALIRLKQDLVVEALTIDSLFS